jgi:hypothetical protein
MFRKLISLLFFCVAACTPLTPMPTSTATFLSALAPPTPTFIISTNTLVPLTNLFGQWEIYKYARGSISILTPEEINNWMGQRVFISTNKIVFPLKSPPFHAEFNTECDPPFFLTSRENVQEYFIKNDYGINPVAIGITQDEITIISTGCSGTPYITIIQTNDDLVFLWHGVFFFLKKVESDAGIATSSVPVLCPSAASVNLNATPLGNELPLKLQNGLSIEEHLLSKAPDSDTRAFSTEDGSTQEAVLAKHAIEREKPLQPYDSFYHGWDVSAFQGGNKLAVSDSSEYNISSGEWDHFVQVNLDQKLIYTAAYHPAELTYSFRALWMDDQHWVLEVACETKPYPYAVGHIVMDGKSLNELYAYEESFGFQTMHGKFFYFFNRGGKIGISYNGQEIPLGYDNVLHYGCCSAGVLNPIMSENMVAFFAQRGGHWYYVEIGVF